MINQRVIGSKHPLEHENNEPNKKIAFDDIKHMTEQHVTGNKHSLEHENNEPN